MELPVELNNKIVGFLKSLPNIHDSNSQRALLWGAGLDSELHDQIYFFGPPVQFFQLLIPTLLSYGKLKDGRDALEAVLEAAKGLVGQDKKDYCDTLIQELQSFRPYLENYEWDHVAYYNTYARCFGIMVGIGELTLQQVSSRAISFKFISKGRHGPVYKVQVVNSRGELTPRHRVEPYLKLRVQQQQSQPMGECQWEFVRDSENRIVYEKAYDKYGKLVWGLVYSPPVEGQPTRAHYVGADGFPHPQASSAAEFVVFEYSPEGYAVSVRYFDRHHQPQPGPDKTFGKHQKFDTHGLVIESCVLDRLGNPTLNKDGYYKVTRTYDERGNSIEEACFDTAGQSTLHKDGFHKVTRTYDKHSNQLEGAYFDTAGHPTLDKNGFHKITNTYNERGNQLEWAYFDTTGNPTRNTWGIHKISYTYNERDKLTKKIRVVA